jgi:hypothetical protein
MFEVDEWSWELIICLLKVFKCEYRDVNKAMFHNVERPFERVCYILGIPKSDFDEVAEVMF